MSGESIGQAALREWLDKEVKLERYFDKFVAHGYGSLAACCNIDDAVLDEVGITPPYHRKRLIKYSETSKNDWASHVRVKIAHFLVLPRYQINKSHSKQEIATSLPKQTIRALN